MPENRHLRFLLRLIYAALAQAAAEGAQDGDTTTEPTE